MMKRKTVSAILAATVSVLALSGCSYRTVDPVQTGAEQVPGTGVLWRFCDRSVLVYVQIVPGEPDNPDAYFRDGCVRQPDGRYIPAIDLPVPSQKQWEADQNMNQQQQEEAN